MATFRRSVVPGATYFFTVNTYQRLRVLTDSPFYGALKNALQQVKAEHPFTIDAFVLLPDHLHCLWTSPPGDANYALRWNFIKRLVSQATRQLVEPPLSHSRQQRRELGLWQRRFWEHQIRDEQDFIKHVEYIHWNDEITRRVFGDYISTYDFQRAVDDRATVPLYYDARGEKLGVATNDLNEKIAEKLEQLEIDDIDVAQRLERELKRDYHILTAKKRLDRLARDFVQHYATSWETGKAMLVCIDKITCVRMYDLITKYWAAHLQKLEAQLSSAADEQDEVYRRRQVEWMKKTRMAVVVSEEQGEVDKFRQWGLDITPHRRLMKEGFETPDGKRVDVDEAFKNPEHPFRIVIVCAMWLTGFDVPSLSTLYLDKPLKAHTLMQAIARANRVHEGKNNGLVVDYCGIVKNLRKALATFAGHQGGSLIDGETPQPEIDPVKPEEELLADLVEAIAFVRSFLEEGGCRLEDIIEKRSFARNRAIIDAKEAVNENDESRKRFEILARQVFKKFRACLTIKGVNDYRRQYDAINIVYASLQADREKADITAIIRELHAVVEGAVEPKTAETGPESSVTYDISRIDFERLRKEFERSPTKNTTVQNLKEAVEKRLHRMVQQNPLRTNFQQHYEEIIAAYNWEKDRVTIEKMFEELLKFVASLDRESTRALREGLDEEILALFDLLLKPDLSKQDIERLKQVAGERRIQLREG
jgi:type I restriction enzyme R subunit